MVLCTQYFSHATQHQGTTGCVTFDHSSRVKPNLCEGLSELQLMRK